MPICQSPVQILGPDHTDFHNTQYRIILLDTSPGFHSFDFYIDKNINGVV